MDFLLECIGFPPGTDERALIERVRAEGEGAPWRGDPDLHRFARLGAGLELRVDRADPRQPWSVLPHFRADHRLRVAVESVRRQPDAPFEVLLHGWASPPFGADAPDPTEAHDLEGDPGAFRIAAWITDGRQLGQVPYPGHVLALALAGFGLAVDAVVPNRDVHDPAILEHPGGAWIAPLGGPEDPGGCCDVSLRVRALRHLANSWTKEPVTVLECDMPERPLQLFVSPWQLARDGLKLPRPGERIEGTFMLTGRVEGGLPRPAQTAGKHFG